MRIIESVEDAINRVEKWKKGGSTIGLVPTMGFLHQGHASLIERSICENDKTVVSIFVNPTQFAPTEDYDKYPRDMEADAEICAKKGVDLIFAPPVIQMYPQGFSTFVDMDGLTRGLCGRSRPTHFRGVCTVVNKLFNIIRPDSAYFGQKDAQQLAVIKRMVKDLNMGVHVVGCPIVREPDGLAKSSRNAYLDPEQRSAALVLSKAVFVGQEMIKSGERDVAKVVEAMRQIILQEPLAKIDYVEIVDSETIGPVSQIEGSILAAVAVVIGTTRLIDNFIYEG
ncbi:MAG: pantoate--beta-alanine ligase [Anaerovoracaceae bacterium]|jgi:pantoate--beta-alanine ligase